MTQLIEYQWQLGSYPASLADQYIKHKCEAELILR